MCLKSNVILDALSLSLDLCLTLAWNSYYKSRWSLLFYS